MALLLCGCASERNVRGQLTDPATGGAPELPNPVQVDTLLQASPPVVDVQWVIDNSCSMSCIVGCHGTVADNVTGNFHRFVRHFEDSGIDYHIGVLTTDMAAGTEQGMLQPGLDGARWIDSETFDPVGSFTRMASRGTSGSGHEQGLDAVHAAHEVHGDALNAGFHRSGSALHTIVLSDEDDRSTSSVPEFAQWYAQLRSPELRSFNAIICDQSTGEVCQTHAIGHRYRQVVHEVGGQVFHILDGRWDQLLDALGAEWAGVSTEYFLSQLPVLPTLTVEVTDGQTGETQQLLPVPPFGVEAGYVYVEERNSVQLVHLVPSPRSVVRLSYEPRSAAVSEN